MNDTGILNKQEITKEACLNTLMYLKKYYPQVNNGTKVSNIVNQIDETISNRIMASKDPDEYAEDLRKLTVIKNAVKNDPSLGKLMIANQTSKMNNPATGLPYEKDTINACTFQDDLNHPSEVNVVICGTGKREWYDNGLGLSGDYVATAQQEQAREYFDEIVRSNNWTASKPKINISGHSKGGNKTQYIVMTSEYADLIDKGYSFDGQGLSPEAIEYLENKYGKAEFDKRRFKLYSISADNDYVNVLGTNNQEGRVIPEDHIFYLKSNLQCIKWHFPDSYLNEDGTLTEFR